MYLTLGYSITATLIYIPPEGRKLMSRKLLPKSYRRAVCRNVAKIRNCTTANRAISHMCKNLRKT